jgi:hypothetical protein
VNGDEYRFVSLTDRRALDQWGASGPDFWNIPLSLAGEHVTPGANGEHGIIRLGAKKPYRVSFTHALAALSRMRVKSLPGTNKLRRSILRADAVEALRGAECGCGIVLKDARGPRSCDGLPVRRSERAAVLDSVAPHRAEIIPS